MDVSIGIDLDLLLHLIVISLLFILIHVTHYSFRVFELVVLVTRRSALGKNSRPEILIFAVLQGVVIFVVLNTKFKQV
jgi:hypothetical protein